MANEISKPSQSMMNPDGSDIAYLIMRMVESTPNLSVFQRMYFMDWMMRLALLAYPDMVFDKEVFHKFRDSNR